MFSAAFIDAVIVSPYTTYEQSELVWNIASSANGNTVPNILSELSYTDLESLGGGAQIEIIRKLGENWALLIRGNTNRAQLQSGKFQDSDYFFNNRQGEYSRSYGDTNNDGSDQWSLALGLKTRWTNQPGHYASVLVGYSEQSLDLLMTNGVQHIPTAYRGDQLEGLASTYDSEYQSWFVELATEHSYSWGIVGLRYRHLDTDLSAKASWNLRTDFAHPVSFTHQGGGDGHTITLGYTLPVTSNVDINLNYQYQKITIEDGYDQTYFNNGFALVTRLNESTLKSKTLSLGISFIF